VTPWALISPARLAGSGLLRTQTDARLVDLVRAGNDRAFEAIVLRYQRSLLRHCRRLLPAGRAEDAVQQALLSALEGIRADQRELQLGPWLHRIAHNTAIDSLRRLDSHWEELDERMDGVEPTHAAAERRARFRSVVASMSSLPERQRRALVLRELEGRSYDEIGADLGVTGAGVRQLLNRARNAMRAGASALVPPALVGRLAGSGAGAKVAELADPPGTSALVAKAGAAVAAGAVALLAVSGPPVGDRGRVPQAEAGTGPAALKDRFDTGGRSASEATGRDPEERNSHRIRPRAAARGEGPARGRRAYVGTATGPGDRPAAEYLDGRDERGVTPRRESGRGGATPGGRQDLDDAEVSSHGADSGAPPHADDDAGDDDAANDAAGTDDAGENDDLADGDDAADDDDDAVLSNGMAGPPADDADDSDDPLE
jgi:RNA polymerase sigma factor (sigma-70 family)